MTGKLSHNELARSLADHLRAPDRMVWCDMQMGPVGSPRPDVYTVFKSYVRPTPTAYECKVSLSDFRADVTAGKWQSYLSFSSGVYFACEAGLITKNDVPEHCGLIVLTNGSWRAAKKPTLRPVDIPQHVWLKLLINGVEREGPVHRAKPYQELLYLQRLSVRFGEIAARTVRDRLAVEDEIESAKRQAKRIVANAQQRADEIKADADAKIAPLRGELCAVLGLAPNADRWQLERAVNKFRESLQEHPAQRDLRRLTNSLRNALERDGFKEPTAVETETV